MSIKHLYEDERPSLLLDFANSKTLDPRITFERQSIGTYVDEAGIIRTAADNEARFDHDPVTGESLGLLIEPTATNLSINSETNWDTSNPQITADTTVLNPSGGTNTFRCDIPSGVTGYTNYKSSGYSQPTLAATDVFSWSTYVKPTGGWTKLAVKPTWEGNVQAFFLLLQQSLLLHYLLT